MKKYIPHSIILAAAATGMAHGAATAYTTPVGYETVTLAPGTFNLTGVRLHASQVGAGTFESFTATTLVDNQAAFALDANTNYIIELPNGATVTALGSNFSTTTISNLSGITSAYVGPYVIRKALTVSSVFGGANQSGLASSPVAAASDADIIYLPKSTGGFTRVFYSTFIDTEAAPANQLDFFGWLDADTFLKADNAVIDPTSALFVQTVKSTTPVQVVISGEVKKTPTAFIAKDSFSLVGGVYPAGSTLTSSGLSNFLQGSATATATEADTVLLPNGTGGFVRAFYSTFVDTEAAPANQLDFNGWLNADTFSKIPDQLITPGFFIQKVGPNISGLQTPPASYSSL